METKISIHIETGDADLAERIGRALNGNLTERYEGAPAIRPEYEDRRFTADALGESHPQTANHAETAAEAENAQHAEGGTAGAHTAGHQEAAPGAAGQGANSSNAPRDQKGVAFNVHYCGEAQDPFYSSGKRSGQWKKKRGVSDKDYDDWYAEELDALQGHNQAADEDSHQPGPVNTAGAFGNGQAQQQNNAPAAPQDTGEFMGWVSEKQAGGLITQDDIQQAYNQAGVQVTDLFPPNDPQTIAGRIRQLYDLLAPKAGA